MYEVKMDSWQKMKENEKKTITLCMSECGMGAYDSASLRFDFNSYHMYSVTQNNLQLST